MRKFVAIGIEDICPFSLFYINNKSSFLVFISTTSKYNYLGFVVAIDTRLNILCGRSIYRFSNNDFTLIKDYNFLFLNGDKIISITLVNL